MLAFYRSLTSHPDSHTCCAKVGFGIKRKTQGRNFDVAPSPLNHKPNSVVHDAEGPLSDGKSRVNGFWDCAVGGENGQESGAMPMDVPRPEEAGSRWAEASPSGTNRHLG